MKCFQIHEQCLKIKKLPEWLLPFTQEIAPILLSNVKTIFEPGLVNKIVEAYQRNPWVKKVKQVTAKYPNIILSTLSLRKPVAFVNFNEKYYLIGEDGVFLPVVYTNLKDVTLPVIAGIEEEIPSAGYSCKDAALHRTLMVLSFLSNKGIWQKLSVQRLSIESFPKCPSKILVMVLRNNMRIIWGNITDPLYVSLSQQEKNLHKLIPFLSEQASIQQNREVDLRFGYNILKIRDHRK